MTIRKLQALFSSLCVILSLACCRSAGEIGIAPDPQGVVLQRSMIAENFAGTDVRSDPIARKEFDSGRRDAVSAAWWGFEEADSTAILQSCLDSGARIILVPDMGKPWIVEPLSLRSGTTLLLEEGVEIQAKKGSFQKSDDALFVLRRLHDVTLYGYGARLAMRKEDYRRPPYGRAEWRHAFRLHGCTGIALYGVTAESSGGDGVYLGSDGGQRFNENVILKDLVLRDHYRQGISVVSAQDLLIENVLMTRTEGTAPSAGIDFEPNGPDERLVRCTLRNCVITANRGAGISFALQALNKSSPPLSVRVEGCIVAGNSTPLFFYGIDGARGSIELHGNALRGIRLVPASPSLKITVN
jgi:hypothetical protein